MNEDIRIKWRNFIADYATGKMAILPVSVQIYLTAEYRNTFGKLPRQCRCPDALKDAAIELTAFWNMKREEADNDTQG